MNESKEVLEATIKGLEEKVNQLNSDLGIKKKELADVNKPVMTGEMYDTLESCIIEGIQDALGNLDAGDIDFEPGLDYNGKVIIESFQIPEDGLVEYIMGEINNCFKILENEANK